MKHWKIYDFYVDDGFSGLNYNRPEFHRMLNDIDSDKVNSVLQQGYCRMIKPFPGWWRRNRACKHPKGT
ncbi:MAG: recombinase family protein [Clostridiales bacterium]|nr:recombinase family protein [Clostridiales bacterium]